MTSIISKQITAIDESRMKLLLELQELLQYQFRELYYLDRALTHSSYKHEAKLPELEDNERLEFLGDAVLNFVISGYLYRTLPDIPEGRLAKLKAVIVSEPVLAKSGKTLQLGKYLRLGAGEIKSGGMERISILGDTFESIIGAIYLDGNTDSVTKFILHQLNQDIQAILQQTYLLDYKSILQEYIQAKFEITPTYQLLNEFGPDHDKRFLVKVMVNGQEFGTGTGKSKKEAEQNAAQQASIKLHITKSNSIT